MTTNADISPYFQKFLDDLYLPAQTQNFFHREITDAVHCLTAPYTSVEDLVDAVQKAARVMTICRGGLLDDKKFANAYDALELPLWSSHTPLKADIDLQKSLGDKLFNIPSGQQDAQASIIIGNGANHIVGHIIERLRTRGIPMQFEIADETFNNLAINHMDKHGLRSFAEYRIDLQKAVTNRMVAIPSAEAPCPIEQDKDKHKAFSQLMKPLMDRRLSGEVMGTLTFFPTPLDAEIDEIPYDEYVNLFFELCDQPDHLIERANDYLIQKLNVTNTLRFTNKDGTDVSMSLVDAEGRHFTFANSMTRRNVPGSEVFSGPRADSVNGVIVSKGKFLACFDEAKQVINLTRHFKDGVMTDFSADQGAEHFQEFLDRDPANYRIGEIGIGTNPHLKRHVANGLLVEKISSSFHTAQGGAYKMTNYLGTPVYMNNGNDSIDHWDITTMLGDMYLDDECILKDGVFLAPELDVLNRGWNAVPVAERPDRWKDYKGPYTGGPA
jgi:aminopeptidase